MSRYLHSCRNTSPASASTKHNKNQMSQRLRIETHAKITMLGTGNALATRCYNTCFTLQDADDSLLLVDAGGGNRILTQLEHAGLCREDIHDIFVTHAHTDHLLGVIWIVRMALQFGCRLNAFPI